MNGKLNRVNRFSKQYYLYPEQMREAEILYQTQLKEFKEQKKREEKSRRTQLAMLERKHNEDIEQLLKNRGFLLELLPTSAEWLSLTLFDDTNYDLYSPKEWLALYWEGNDPIEFRGKTLVQNSNFSWIAVKVLDYDEDESLWVVENVQNEKLKVLRVNLVFDCEDKNIFAARFIQAYSERVFLDSFLRYNFYIDAMPTVGIAQQSKKVLDEIIEYARNFKSLRTKKIFSNRVINRIVESFYYRTFNKILFNNQLSREREHFANRHNLILPDEFFNHKESKEKGLVQLSRNVLKVEHKEDNVIFPASMNFQENFKLFCLNSIFNRRSVLKVLKEVEEANRKILSQSIFEKNFTEPLSFDNFRNNQESATTKFLNHCKINWLKDVMTAISKNLKDETAWFNLKNINMDNYLVGKLKALLDCVDQKLADVLRVVVSTNYKDFMTKFLSYLPLKVTINSSNSVEHEWKDAPCIPLFVLSAKLDEARIIFPESPELFEEFIILLVQRSLEELGKLNRIEEQVLKNNLDGKFESCIPCPNLKPIVDEEKFGRKTYEDSNTWLIELFNRFKKRISEIIAPASKYLEYYKSLESELGITSTDYLNQFESKNPNYSITALLDEIKIVRSREKELLKLFPEDLQVSVFRIENGEIQVRIKELSSEIEKAIYKLIEERGRVQLNELLGKSLKSLKMRLKEKPKTLEEMTQLDEYLQTQLMDELNVVSSQIEELREVYGILEENRIKVSADDMKKFWMTVGGPKEIIDAKKSLQQDFVTLKSNFEKELNADQLKYELDLESLRRSYETFSKNYELDRADEIFHDATLINESMKEMLRKATLYNSREGLLQKPVTDYSFVQEFERSFRPLFNFWKVTHKWANSKNVWMEDTWENVDAAEADSFSSDGLTTISQTIAYLAECNKKHFEKLTKNAMIIRKEIEDFAGKVPLLVALKREGMTERHWESISQKINRVVNPTCTDLFNFKYILGIGLLNHKAFCVEVGEKAAREFEIEKALERMYTKWAGIELETVTFKREDVFVVKTFDKVETELDEDFGTVNGMLVNPFREPFDGDITKWNETLLLISNVVEEWRRFQAQWAYLQPIFDSPDIARQLPAENNIFKKTDIFYRQFLSSVNKGPNMLRIARGENLLEKIVESNEDLEMIQRELNNYLEVKRSKFARFYFLSNDELLSILSETKDVMKIQGHLRKVFENLGSLVFNEKLQITAMKSLEGERVDFSTVINPLAKQVEDWMSDVENQMVVSMRRELVKSVQAYEETTKTKWVLEHPGQCVLNGSQIVWTNEVEEAIRTGTVSEYMEKTKQDLLSIVTLDRSNLNPMNIIAIEALIVIEVHAQDILELLIKSKIADIAAFEWISQLRYYLVEELCQVRCIQTNFPYGYEYLGNTSRLVITPLTDKCYMTLMGALRLNLGGAPAGPAGTGKTETTKDLAKALAKQCVVFNCQESMDYLFLAKFFKGLASSGAWCCFDEFNRINIEVLSVIAQQLQDLFRAKAEGVREMKFEDAIIRVEPTFSVYITMNPGYAGRTELPDNLKALFRSVAMMVPDYSLIAQIKLYSFGFTRARELAQKMVDTFKLSSEQLSNQRHYDYGMRAVTSVINAAGLFRQLLSGYEGMTEEQLLYKALIDVNVPKFLPEDIPLFQNILRDLFPSLIPLDTKNAQLTDAISVACRNLNVQLEPKFLEKVLQLYDTIQVRHGLMLVGPTGSGKSTCCKVLRNALNYMEKPVRMELINPKAMNLVELYGESKDLNWIEGVIEMVMERAIKESATEKRWVMFDGPVDAVWIESMNTVLDDNKRLCLASGKVLILSSGITMMFEVEDLLVASPATVSRCGMIYMGSEDNNIWSLFTSFLNTLPEELMQQDDFEQKFTDLVKTCLEPAVEYQYSKKSDFIFDVPEVVVFQGFLRLFEALLTNAQQNSNPETFKEISNHLPEIVTFCTLWSVGCLGDRNAQKEFEKYYNEQILRNSDHQSLFAKEFDFGTFTWRNWNTGFENYEISPGTQFHEIVIPTVDFCRGLKLGKLLLQSKMHVLLPGPVGSGKTVCGFKLLSEHLSSDFNSLSLGFSARTSPSQVTDYFFSQIEKRRKGVYGPKNGRKVVIFLDDLNMPQKEDWGAQPPLELLRQYLDQGSWHVMRLNKEYVKIEDVVILGAMVPPKAGRNDISQRLVRNFNVLPFLDFDESLMQTVYEKILNFFLVKKIPDCKAALPAIVTSSIEVFKSVSIQLLPTPSKSHYIFNLRDLARTIHGLTTLQNSDDVVKNFWILWMHENERAYSDRLNEQKDILKFRQILTNALTKHNPHQEFKCSPGEIIYSNLMSGNYMRIDNPANLVSAGEKILEQFNAESSPKNQMRLVMFLDACKYVSRMAKALSNPQGHTLILGVGGSGRQSLSRLSAFACGFKPFQIEPSKGYGPLKWKEDLKRLFLTTVCENTPIGFIMNDTQITHESFLEDINSLLNTGLLVGLPFLPDELKRLDDASREECIRKGLPVNKMNILNCQINILKRNLHILLAMSPAQANFPQRVRMFPSLVNCCTLIWFHKWPEEALEGVAKQFLQQNMTISAEGGTVTMLKKTHRFVEQLSVEYYETTRRVNHLTPTSYLELLNTYKIVHKIKKAELAELYNRFETGVQKLTEANQQVEDIRIHLRNEEPKLKIAEVEVKELLEKVAKDRETENETKKVVALEEAEAATQQLEANALKKSAEESVRLANEELDRALEKIQLLKPANIIEIRTVNNPVRKLRLVIAAVCYLLLDNSACPGFLRKNMSEDDFWPLGKNNLLNDPNKLFNTLITPETKDNIEPARIRKVSDLVKKAADVWTEKEMKNSSLANYYLFLWVDCILSYTEISEKTRPIRQKLEEVTKILDEKTAFLEKKKQELEASTRRLKELEDLYNEKIALKEELFRRISQCNIKLERASKLTTLLADEAERWRDEIKKIGGQLDVSAADSLLVACELAYFGPFDSIFRGRIEEFLLTQMNQLQLTLSSNLRMIDFLISPISVLNWNICGLPKDETSINNGILIHKSQRWPLLIDPQGRGSKFVKNIGKTFPMGMEILKASSQNLIRQLEQAIQLGKWVLLEGVGLNLDPLLEPLLQQKIFSVSGGKAISLGENTVPYNDNFRFLLSTSLSNPFYAPEVFSKVTVINFCITPIGLEEHLLAQIVLFENRELENKKTEIVVVNADDRQKLKEIEDNILNSLQESKGDVLMDESLIIRLTQSKKTFSEINARLAEATVTEKEIDEIREKYRDAAYFVSCLFFLVSELVSVDSMYQYSLQWFEALFGLALETSPPSQDLSVRLNTIRQCFLFALFENVSVSLYSQHKLLFAFLLTIKTLQAYDKIDVGKYNYFLMGGIETLTEMPEKFDFIPENAWARLIRELKGLNKLRNCEGILEHFLAEPEGWKTYYESEKPEEAELPGNWDNLLDDFDKLLILKAFRLDKVTNGLQYFIQLKLGEKFVEAPILKLEEVYKGSNAIQPLVFMVTSGADPKASFDALSMKIGVKSISAISLGQGQGPKAEKMIKETAKVAGEGGWILLQNCHLSASWLPRLEIICEDFSLDTIHPDFRLWMTTMPCPGFPVSILRNSRKMTIEPPKSFKENLKINYTQLDERFLANNNKPEHFRKLLFGLSVFHAVVQERKKYGSIGWNIPYEFTQEDFGVCKQQLFSFLNDYEAIPFKVLQFVFAEINYGGRVTDDKDLRLINALISTFINEDALNDGHCFSQDPYYYSIAATTQREYLGYIDSMPLHTNPEVMGLHKNSEIMTNQNESLLLLSLAKSIQPTSTSRSQSESDGETLDLIRMIREKIPEPLNLQKIRKDFPIIYQDSFNTVLIQEALKFNELIQKLYRSTANLKLAVEGLLVLNQDLEAILKDIQNFKVPASWGQTFLSLKPLFPWLTELNQRVEFFRNWGNNGRPSVIWFNAFSFPQAFLTGALQNYARSTQTAIDKLEFRFEALQDRPSSDPETGVYVDGLFLEGANWNLGKKELEEAIPNELYSKLPVLWLIPVFKNTCSKEGFYSCPLYKTLARSGILTTTGHSSNFVMKIDLKTDTSVEHWVRRGTACFLALKE